MVSGRKKDEMFGDTAKSYIASVMSERLLDPDMVNDDYEFENYLNETSHTTKAMAWGTAYESMAREEYERINGVEVAEAPSIKHPDIDCLSCSPDGLVGDDGLIEVKSPQGETFIKYAKGIATGATLPEMNKTYYWQVQCQLAVTGRQWCDFVVYHPYIAPRIKSLRVYPNTEDIDKMLERVRVADKLIKSDIKILVNDEF
jgi:exodeoxyribonuclease (lambda-induced)